MWQLLYVGINPGENCSFIVAPTRYFSTVCLLVTCKDLENYYWECRMHPQNILPLGYPTIFVAWEFSFECD